MQTLTGVGVAIAVGPSRRSAISRLHLQRVGTLLLPIENDLGENFPSFLVDFKEVLPLVPRRLHDIVIHLKSPFIGELNEKNIKESNESPL